jgi:Na+-translocating ferredoxin:NAD+ oxidoreductase RNF subunit RnfB
MILAETGIWQLWNSSWPAGLTMLALGAGFAVALLIASEKLKVEIDPRVAELLAALPGLDCGTCGFPGCGRYAQAVLANPELFGKCSPGGQDSSDKMAAVLNVQASNRGALRRPIVHCRAQADDKSYFGSYGGIPTCTAANALANVQACKFGCLGFSDCVEACKFDALHVVEGLAMVDYEKCTGCTACSKACPRDLIQMVPFSHENMLTVACSSKENGRVTRSMCQVGCIGCGLCAKQTDVFIVEDNLARLDYEKYQPGEQAETAYKKCPTGTIVYRGKNVPADRQPAEKPTATATA